MKKVIFAALAVLVLGLCGCGAASVEKLKESPGNKLSFDTGQNYESAYKKAVKYARANEFTTIGGPHMDAKCDLYNDMKKGEVSLVMHNIIGAPQVFVSVDIKGVTQNESSVSIYSAMDSDVRLMQMKEAILAD